MATHRFDSDAHGFVLGVTGHRVLPEGPGFERVAAEAIGGLLAEWPGAPVTLLTALAEGADRLVAHLLLEQEGTRLVAVLPLPPEEYARDFRTAESRAEFAALLDRADEIVVLPASESRSAAYEAAGEAVVDGCETLIALWDGEPARGQGGTANVVASARARHRGVLWIATTPPYAVRWIDPTERNER